MGKRKSRRCGFCEHPGFCSCGARVDLPAALPPASPPSGSLRSPGAARISLQSLYNTPSHPNFGME